MDREEETQRERGSRRSREGRVSSSLRRGSQQCAVAPRLVSSTNTIAAKNHPLCYRTRTQRRGNDENEGREAGRISGQ